MSPTIFKVGAYRFFLFSREEPRMHIHVVSPDGEAKFGLEPDIELAKNYRAEHYDEIVDAWQRHFGR